MSDLFRISFSILEPWSQGNFDEAVRRWMRVETPATPAMEDGKVFHEKWRSETQVTGALPQIFGGKKLIIPECEVKMECILDGWIQLVGVVDLLADREIHEYKTGHANSIGYAGSMQTRCYQLLCAENGITIDLAYIHHLNQHNGKVTNSKIYLSENSKEMARDWVETYASEMYNALKETGNL